MSKAGRRTGSFASFAVVLIASVAPDSKAEIAYPPQASFGMRASLVRSAAGPSDADRSRLQTPS